jgi:acyl carrier protein
MTITTKTLEAQVIDVIAKKLELDPAKVVPAASFVGDLGADSLDTAELIMALEEDFKIEIPDEEAQSLQTVQNAIDYVVSKAHAMAKETETV